jgi:hypothetical protein
LRKSIGAPTSPLKKSPGADPLLKFSFMHFDDKDSDLCPSECPPDYTHSLMRRLRALSQWTVKKFTGKYEKTIRNHNHDWDKTSRPGGFGSLKGEFRDLDGWQFCLEDGAHGRVHGVILSDTFFIIWLDIKHQLNPDPDYDPGPEPEPENIA